MIGIRARKDGGGSSTTCEELLWKAFKPSLGSSPATRCPLGPANVLSHSFEVFWYPEMLQITVSMYVFLLLHKSLETQMWRGVSFELLERFPMFVEHNWIMSLRHKSDLCLRVMCMLLGRCSFVPGLYPPVALIRAKGSSMQRTCGFEGS